MDIRVSFPVKDTVQRQLPSVLRSGPFHHALSVAISARGLTLEQLKNRLAAHGIHLSTATLSYWKNGRRLPTRLESLRGLSVLERELGLEPQSLARLLARPDDPPMVAEVPARELPSPWPVPPRNTALRKLSVHDSLHIGPDRRPFRFVVREVVQATQDVVAGTFAAMRAAGSERAPVITATHNCSPGQVRTVDAVALAETELVLDRKLARGETAVIGYEYEFRDAEADDYHHRHIFRPMNHHLLEVHFSGAAIPARCHSYRRELTTGRDHDVREVELDSLNTAHLTHVNLIPGTFGLRWEWGC